MCKLLVNKFMVVQQLSVIFHRDVIVSYDLSSLVSQIEKLFL